MADAVFRREGDRFVPGPDSTGPWGVDRLHGGPVFGLMARAVEAAASDPDLILVRLSVDLYRPVPVEPLGVRVQPLRQGARLQLFEVLLTSDGEAALARGTALLLRASDAPAVHAGPESATPVGPEGLATESLLRGFSRQRGPFPPGFHTRVETRWVPRAAGDPLTIWFRLPIPLVAGEQPSPLQCVVALSDFANAVASIGAAERGRGSPYINADSTLYLSRRPFGEWFCLQEHGASAERGVGVAEMLLYDARGALGRVLQARLAVR